MKKEEIETIKIGKFVRDTLYQLFKNNYITENEVKLMQTKEYSKNTFHIDYPLIIRSNIIDKEVNKRYWKFTVEAYGETYRICNDWYESEDHNDRVYFEK